MRSSLVCLVLLAAGCTKRPEPGLRVAALLPFEELAGGNGAESLRLGLSEALRGQPALMVLTPSHRRELPDSGAHLLLEGYATPGAYHLTVDNEPLSCRGALSFCGQQLVAEVAKRLGIVPRIGFDAEGLSALAAARGKSDEAGWRAAVALRPADPLTWIGLATWVASKSGSAAAFKEIQLAPAAEMKPYDQARLELAVAELSGDRRRRALASSAFARLNPADLGLHRRAAAELIETRDFKGAIELLERVIALAPQLDFVNDAAYAAAFAGDKAKAAGFAERLAKSGQSRYVDTAGEIAYFFGDYAASASHFESVIALDAAFLQGEIYWKLAEARRLAGQIQEADKHFDQFAALRQKSGQDLSLLRIVWNLRKDNRTPSAQTFRSAIEALLSHLPPGGPAAAAANGLLKGPVPPNDGMAAFYYYLHGDPTKSLESLRRALPREHPFASGNLRVLEMRLTGQKLGLLPPRADDFISLLL